VRLTEEEERLLARRSRSARMKRSTYVRMLIRDEPFVTAADVLADVPKRVGDVRLRRVAQTVRNCLLDSSFLIDLLNEMADAREGPAISWLKRNEKSRLWISPVTVAEVLEGAADPQTVGAYLARYSWQAIHRVHAEKVALRQMRSSKRLGENDAWQAAGSGVHGRRHRRP